MGIGAKREMSIGFKTVSPAKARGKDDETKT